MPFCLFVRFVNDVKYGLTYRGFFVFFLLTCNYSNLPALTVLADLTSLVFDIISERKMRQICMGQMFPDES